MITDKRRGSLCIAVAFCMLVSLCIFIGCSKKSDNTLLESLLTLDRGENTDADDSDTQGPVPAAQYYRIVISGMCSSETASAARRLAESIEDKTGIDCGVVYDIEDFPERENAVEICVGNTNRDASAIALEEMRYDDYVCELVNNSLVIGGLSDSATITAVERFISELLPLAEGMYLIEDTSGFEYIHKYEINSVTLCGFDIGDYGIVCSPSATADEKMFASLLGKLVADKSGIYLDTRYALEGEYGRKEIIFRMDAQADMPSAYVRTENEDIVISGSDTYGMSLAVSGFCKALLDSAENGQASLAINGELKFPYKDTKLKLMSVHADVAVSHGNLMKFEYISRDFNAAMPDITVLGAIEYDAWEYIKYHLSSDFAFVEQSADGVLYMPVMYRKSSVEFRSMSCEEKDGMQIQKLVFSHIVSGERYTVLSFVLQQGADIAKCAETVKAAVKDNENSVAMLTAPQSVSGMFSISDNAVISCYGKIISVGDKAFFNSMYISADDCIYTDTVTEYGDDGDICYVTSAVGRRYSSDYTELVSKNTVD